MSTKQTSPWFLIFVWIVNPGNLPSFSINSLSFCVHAWFLLYAGGNLAINISVKNTSQQAQKLHISLVELMQTSVGLTSKTMFRGVKGDRSGGCLKAYRRSHKHVHESFGNTHHTFVRLDEKNTRHIQSVVYDFSIILRCNLFFLGPYYS